MEVVLSEQTFVHYRPMGLCSSCLESDCSKQKVNEQLLAVLSVYFGPEIVID